MKLLKRDAKCILRKLMQLYEAGYSDDTLAAVMQREMEKLDEVELNGKDKPLPRPVLVEVLRRRAASFSRNGPAYARGSTLISTGSLLRMAANLIEGETHGEPVDSQKAIGD